jgi:hypothetical protein
MAERADIEFFSGNTVKLKFTITDGDAPPAAKDLTGATAIIWALAKAQGKVAQLTKTLGAGVTITDAAAGKVEVLLSKTDTEPFGGTYYHEMRVTDAASNTATTTYGVVTIQKNTIAT